MPKLVNDSERCQEKAYWTHFKDQKFVKIFKSEHQSRLLIPQKFVGSLGTSFDALVKVQDSSKIVWEFSLLKRSNAVYFDQGWKKFVSVHCLQENDILIFTYVGQMHFDVLIFENQTSCERVSSYFLDGLHVHDAENKFAQSSSSDHGLPFVSDTGGSISQGSRLKKPGKRYLIGEDKQDPDCLPHIGKKVKEAVNFSRLTDQDLSQHADVGPQILEPLASPSIRTSAFSTQKISIRDKNCFSDPEDAKCSDYYADPMPSPAAVKSTGPKKANTEVLLAELRKHKALQLAYASAKGIWSVYTMRQSYISQGFSMTLATKWARQYLPSHSQDIILRNDGQVWNVRFYRKGTGYALTGGWKKFAIDNDLREDDVCVFYLDTAAFGAVTMDVGIFRHREIEIEDDAISAAALGRVNQISGQKKKNGKASHR